MHTIVIGKGFLGEHVVDRLASGDAMGVKLKDFLNGKYNKHLTSCTTIVLTSAIVRHTTDPNDYTTMKYINVDCALAVAKRAVASCCKAFFFVSTTGAVNEHAPCDGPVMDASCPRAAWLYYKLKAECEEELRRYYDTVDTPTKFVFFRLPMLIGPPCGTAGIDGAKRSNRVLLYLLNRKVFFDLGGVIALMDVRDAAGGIVHAIDDGGGALERRGFIGYNLTISDLARALRCRVPRVHVPSVAGTVLGKCLTTFNMKVLGFDGITFQMGSHNWGTHTSRNAPVRPLVDTLRDVCAFYQFPTVSPKKNIDMPVYDGFNLEGLSDDCAEGKTYFVTGATGFLGKMVVARLCALVRPRVVYVLVRGKRSKTAEDRFAAILDSPPVRLARKVYPDVTLRLVKGDCSKHCFGINFTTLDDMKSSVDVVVHSAASVSFSDTMDTCIRRNVHTAAMVVQLVNMMDRCRRLVYVSTAYVNKRSNSAHPAHTRPLASLSAPELDRLIASVSEFGFSLNNPFGFVNAYTFSKAIAEEKIRHLLNLPTELCIVRPSVIIEACSWPFPGYHHGYGGTVGVAYMYATGVLVTKGAFGDAYRHGKLDEVPVDMCADTIVATASSVHPNNQRQVRYVNATMGCTSLVPRLAVLDKYVSFFNVPYQFECLTAVRLAALRVFNPAAWKKLCNMAISVPQQAVFTKGDFHFVSDIPYTPGRTKTSTYLYLRDQMKERLCPSGALDKQLVSAEFINIAGQSYHGKSTVQRMGDVWPLYWLCLTFMMMGIAAVGYGMGWWPPVFLAMAWIYVSSTWMITKRPFGALYAAISYPVARVLDTLYSHVWIHKSSMYDIDTTTKDVVVFCASHSSYLDFVLLPFIMYVFPSVFQVQRPHIVACESFSTIPIIGRCLRYAGAIFISRKKGERGKSSTSPGLTMEDAFLSKLLAKKNDKPVSFILFPWGTRSRDDMPLKGKSGALRALRCAARAIGATVKYVSVGITYDRRLDESLLFEEKVHGGHARGVMQQLVPWLVRIFYTRMVSSANHVYGNVYVQFGTVPAESGESVATLTSRICDQIASLRFVSLYDIECIRKHTKLSTKDICDTLRQSHFRIAPLPICDQWKHMLATDPYTFSRFSKYSQYL